MISIEVAPKGRLEKKILTSVREMIRSSGKTLRDRAQEWRKLDEKFVGYMPVKDADAVRKANRENGTPEYTTIQLPYSYAVAMAAHSFFSSVYLGRSPIFQFMGSTDEGEQQVLAMEALHNYQVFNGRMRPNLYIYFQDVAKYGEAWISPYWRVDRSRVSQIVEEQASFLGIIQLDKTVRKRRITEVVSYAGNALYNVHPAKVFTDPRYPRNRFQDGEFVAVETTLSRNQLVVGKDEGQYINIELLNKKRGEGRADESVFEEPVAPVLEVPDEDDYGTDKDEKASDVYKVYEVCVNLIPKLWGLGQSGLPEKWVFTVDSTFSVVVECRPLGCIHDKFPLAMIEIEPEGYANFSRSLLEIYSPLQDTLDWLVNSHFFNVRASLNNSWVVDPSRVQERDFLNRTPGRMIRLKPAAYGTDVRTAMQQLQTVDVTRTHFQDMSMLYDLGERLGINDQVMGMSAPSSRRSAQEIRGDQTFGISRLKTMTEYFSATGFSDLAMMLVKNSQQYYDSEMKIRLAGEAGMMAGEPFVNVTPETIAGNYLFEPVDGTLPVDRYAQANLWRTIISEMAGVPQVIAQYDLGKIFGYVAQLGGIKNLNRFRIQIMPDQALQMAAQAGNVTPANNVLEPGQIAGVGPTA